MTAPDLTPPGGPPPDIDALLADELEEDEPAIPSPPLRAWWGIALMSGAMSVGAAIGSGVVLSAAGVGRAAVARGCDGGFASGLALLVGAGVLLGVTRIVADRRSFHEVRTDWSRLLSVAAPPMLLAALTTPGFLGCEWAADIAGWGEIGRGLVGVPGVALAGASAFAAGFAVTTVVRVSEPMELVAAEYARRYGELPPVEEPGIVDRVLAEHEAREAGGDA